MNANPPVTERSSDTSTLASERKVADVSDLSASDATTYAAESAESDDVYLERRGGRTFVVARR